MAIERRNPKGCCWLCEPGGSKRRELRDKAQRREDQDMRSRWVPPG